jgi:hypothetical protein
MNYPDYIDFYAAASLGLDGFEVVNIAGWSNQEVEDGDMISVVSSSPADEGMVEIDGLQNGLKVNFEIELEGVNPIFLGDVTRINSVVSKDNNEGIITVGKHKISPFVGKSEAAIYSIPADMSGFILSLASPNDIEIDLKINGIRELTFRKWHKFIAPLPAEGDITFESADDVYVIAQILMQKRGL